MCTSRGRLCGIALFGLVLVPLAVHSAEVGLGLIVRSSPRPTAVADWDLWAWASEGDNDGIMRFNVEMLGENLRGAQEGPQANWAGNPQWGFVATPTIIPNLQTGNVLFNEMQYSPTPPLGGSVPLYGVGSPDIGERIPWPSQGPLFTPYPSQQIPSNYYRQILWDWAIPGFDVGGSAPFTVPNGAFLVADGFADNISDVDFGSVADVDVFTLGQFEVLGFEHEPANVTLFVTRIPEPSAAVLLALCIVWWIRKRGQDSFLRNRGPQLKCHPSM